MQRFNFSKHFLTLLLLTVGLASSRAQSDSLRAFTTEHPLVYEDVWNLWPYSFLNDQGEPDGYNIDLIRLIMKELHIPYVIKLRPSNEAFHDLKDGRSDLTLGVAAGFHDEFGKYGTTSVTLFTQSVVTPKAHSVEIHNLRDLGKHRVIVSDSSLCHHLMMDYGWGNNAEPCEDIREAIQQMSATEEGQIVWNTLSLKWLLERYHIDNLVLTPVNMPHGEYRFMSNNEQLLRLLDEAYARLYSADKVTPIQNKWFYPERQEESLPQWLWYVTGGVVLLILILCIYAISYRIQAGKLTRDNLQRNKRLALIMETSHVRIWTYDIKARQFTWRNENGLAAYTYTKEEFARRYSPEDFVRLHEALELLAVKKKVDAREEEEELTLSLRALDTEDGDAEMRDFVITLSVLRREKDGTPALIIGTKKDVTIERQAQRSSEERTLRYWALFNTPMVGILLFDKNGQLTNINPKACEILQCDHDEMVAEGVRLQQLLDLGHAELEEVDGYYATLCMDLDKMSAEERQIPAIKRNDQLRIEWRLLTVNDDAGDLLGVFAICRDVSALIESLHRQQAQTKQIEEVSMVLHDYEEHIDRLLHESDLRLATYSPTAHVLTIHKSAREVQHALTQARCMTLVDSRAKKLAMRMLNDMDERTDKPIMGTLRTTLRRRGGLQLQVHFNLAPVYDKSGLVSEYVGLCRDFSELCDIEERMAREASKVQEVENTKNSFVKNMVQEIRKPMDTVVDYANRLVPEAPAPNEAMLRQGILDNADYLLHLIENILYLSRLEAHMVEISRQPRNFAELFEGICATGWARYQNEQTRYVVENPYEQMVVNIDADNLGYAIRQIVANAAQHTHSGTIRTRYDYIGRRLVISVDDTGDGIAKAELARLNAPNTTITQQTKGLGLAICRELLSQMDGMIEIYSEEGSGTTVYLSVPCTATVIKRKKHS